MFNLRYRNNLKAKSQRGAATLLVTVMLLIGVTLIVLYAARVGILDQRISGNEYRHKEAFAKAESGLEQAASHLRANPTLHDSSTLGWTSCSGYTNFPCNVADFVYLSPSANIASPSLPMLTTSTKAYLVKNSANLANTIAIGEGASADATGAAIVQIEYAKTSLLNPGEIPPLMSPIVDLSGSFTIVPNPNGSANGQEVSAWVKTMDLTKNTGGWNTCHSGDFMYSGEECMDSLTDSDSWSGCVCTKEINNKVNLDLDAADGELNLDITDEFLGQPFPYSPFAYVFGGDEDIDTDAEVTVLKEEVKARAEATGELIPNCSGTTLTGINLLTIVPLVWVEGDCDIPAGSVVGSRSRPIILVVEGDVKFNANVEVWGIIVAGFLDDSIPPVPHKYTMNGGAVMHGSAISENGGELKTNGSYAQIYDKDVFSALSDPTLTTDIAKIRYSWRDFAP